jgi:hypothetical protein
MACVQWHAQSVSGFLQTHIIQGTSLAPAHCPHVTRPDYAALWLHDVAPYCGGSLLWLETNLRSLSIPFYGAETLTFLSTVIMRKGEAGL